MKAGIAYLNMLQNGFEDSLIVTVMVFRLKDIATFSYLRPVGLFDYA